MRVKHCLFCEEKIVRARISYFFGKRTKLTLFVVLQEKKMRMKKTFSRASLHLLDGITLDVLYIFLNCQQ